MDFLKAQIARIQQQLGGLGASQKMLTAALVVIMVMTLLWWSRYAGTPEMESVLEQDLSPQDITNITADLAAKNINYKVVGARIMVPPDQKFQVIAQLGFSQLLPHDTSSTFNDMINKMGMFDSEKKEGELWNLAKQQLLARVIQNFPGVRQADVVINDVRERHVGGDLEPSATVNINMRSSDTHPTKPLINAAADTVAGAVAGMSRGQVHVIVDGVSFKAHDQADDGGGMGGDEYMDVLKEGERYYSQKIANYLADIDGVMVSVTVEPQTKSTDQTSTVYDAKGTVSKPLQDDTHEEDSNNSSHGGADPGVGSNVQIDLGAGSGGGDRNTNTVNEEKVTYENKVPTTFTHTQEAAGATRATSASIRIPRSYLVRAYKAEANDPKDPPKELLDPFADAEMARIRDQVTKGCIDVKPEFVSVAMYVDTGPQMVAPPESGTTQMSFAVGGHVKEIALGGLAVVSLFMMSMMVRKGSPAQPPPPVKLVLPPTPTQRLAGDETVAGEATEDSGTLDGMELDEESVRMQQVVSQVSTMVGENPDGAANLVKRWLNRT